jgi:CHASE2 domain-containing sensor protein
VAGGKRAGGPGWRTPPGLYWALGLALFVQLLEFYGWLASPEGILLNLFLGGIPLHASTSPAAIATLEVDDQAFDQCFGGHSPMNPEGIKKLVDRALEARPRAVGVDIITDSAHLSP